MTDKLPKRPGDTDQLETQVKTYDIKDKEDRVFAFEVGNGLLSRRKVVKIAQTLPGAKILKASKAFSWFREEAFCEFEIAGHIFEVCELAPVSTAQSA